jgi:HK97 family phage major capsid protein
MADENKTPEQIAAETKAAFTSALDKTREIAEKALAEAKSTGDATKETKAKADEALTAMGEIKAQLSEISQTVVRGQKQGHQAPASIGRQFVESESYKSLQAKADKRGRASMEIKAEITSATTDAAGSAGDLVASTRVPGIIDLPQRRLTVRGLLMQGRMDGNLLEYIKETGFTNSAASVAETGALAQSDIKFDLVSTGVKSIGHYMKASRIILDDASQLASFIDGRLRYGLALVEENQILKGDGTGNNLLGVIPQATAYSAPFTIANATQIDILRLALLQASLAEYPASGIVMHPTDWAVIETLKDTLGRYIIGNPQGGVAPTLWGQPVVATQAMTEDKFLVGAFGMGSELYDRQSAMVEIATENEDDFLKRKVTVAAHERLALAVYRPEAFVYGDLGRVA